MLYGCGYNSYLQLTQIERDNFITPINVKNLPQQMIKEEEDKAYRISLQNNTVTPSLSAANKM
jgi:hypothetical protein